MMHFIVLFALIGVTGAKWANFENQKCLENCIDGTLLATKLKVKAIECAEDTGGDNDRKKRAIDLDEEEQIGCSTYEEIRDYLEKVHCELEAIGWMTEEGQESENTLQVHWNAPAVKADIDTCPNDHKLKTYFDEKNPETVKAWLVACGKEKKATLRRRLLQPKYCADVYTADQKTELRDVLDKYGWVFTQNMCLRRLFGVACGCNDIKGKMTPENNN